MVAEFICPQCGTTVKRYRSHARGAKVHCSYRCARLSQHQDRPPPTVDPFASRVRVDERGCWIWSGHISREGYGRYGERYAHRVMYERHKGPIPDGTEIDHLCRVRSCCNPDHLEAVPHRVNSIRGTVGQWMKEWAATITHCPQGHEYTPANLRPNKAGKKSCRECHRITQFHRNRVKRATVQHGSV